MMLKNLVIIVQQLFTFKILMVVTLGGLEKWAGNEIDCVKIMPGIGDLVAKLQVQFIIVVATVPFSLSS